jgi:hypothetical protein
VTFRRHRVFSLTMLGLFVCLLAGGIHEKTRRAVAPPIYDPIGYIEKGHSIWQLIVHGPVTNPLNAAPALRPPGCVPFTYPFGYSPDVKRFLFWSTFSPIAVWILALGLGLGRQVNTPADLWSALALGVGLVSLPMFYHFEINMPIDQAWIGQWGLQDCLLAALAALAASLMTAGASTRHLGTTVAAWGVSAYTLLVKPSGLLVMLIVGWIWAVEMLLSARPAPGQPPPRGFKSYFWITAICGAAIYLLVSAACFFSDYLGTANLATGIKAQAILRLVYSDRTWMHAVWTYVRPTLGWPWAITFLLLLTAGLIRAAVQLVRRKLAATQGRLMAALMVLLVAGVWWIGFAGVEARYLFPFILIVVAWGLPEVMPLLRRLNPPTRSLIAVLCVVPTVLLIGMLWLRHPPAALQHALGYNLSTGGHGEVVTLAKAMIGESRASGKPIVIYSEADYTGGVIHAVDLLESINGQVPPALAWVRPIDWVRDPGIRFSDLKAVDYILQENTGPQQMPAERSSMATLGQEIAAYKLWLASLDESDGVKRLGNEQLIYLKITDKGKLADSFRKFVRRFVWRREFEHNNPELFRQPG